MAEANMDFKYSKNQQRIQQNTYNEQSNLPKIIYIGNLINCDIKSNPSRYFS